nr:hypothetical protein [Tanacetum cinerariifolium]
MVGVGHDAYTNRFHELTRNGSIKKNHEKRGIGGEPRRDRKDRKVLRIIGERPDEKVRHLVSAKAKEQKREELIVVRYFPEVFPDDLSALPPSQEIKFVLT